MEPGATAPSGCSNRIFAALASTSPPSLSGLSSSRRGGRLLRRFFHFPAHTHDSVNARVTLSCSVWFPSFVRLPFNSHRKVTVVLKQVFVLQIKIQIAGCRMRTIRESCHPRCFAFSLLCKFVHFSESNKVPDYVLSFFFLFHLIWYVFSL